MYLWKNYYPLNGTLDVCMWLLAISATVGGTTVERS
jgi:hypothetical protein